MLDGKNGLEAGGDESARHATATCEQIDQRRHTIMLRPPSDSQGAARRLH